MAKNLEAKVLESPDKRAEDIILGGLGYGDDAQILSIEVSSDGFQGIGKFTSDQSEFDFSSDEELSDLERWALEVLAKRSKK